MLKWPISPDPFRRMGPGGSGREQFDVLRWFDIFLLGDSRKCICEVLFLEFGEINLLHYEILRDFYFK